MPTNTNVPDEMPDGLVELDIGMSNFDHSIDPGLEDALRAGGTCAEHSAWEFHGYVWFDGEQFCERVKRYRVVVGYYRAPTLRELMEKVNAAWGWK